MITYPPEMLPRADGPADVIVVPALHYFKCRVRDRRGGGIEIVADFLLPADSEDMVFRLLKAAYPDALEYHALEVVLLDAA